LAIQRDAARSRTCLGSIEGCASKSKPASSFRAGKWASQSHVDAPVILAGDLALAQHDQRFPRRQVGTRRLVEQAVELITDARELQSRQHGVQRIGGHLGGSLCAWHQKLPPIAASYSAKGRSSDDGGDCGTGGASTARWQTGPSRPATPSRWARSTCDRVGRPNR
jgi:hypothetical protein